MKIEEMEISKIITDDITWALNSALLDTSFDIILKEVFDVAAGRTSINTTQNSKIKGNEEKALYNGLLRFLIEAAKHNADQVSVSGLLEECKMNIDQISLVLKKYQENKEEIQSQLLQIGTTFDHIVDVKWRQDYIIKSNNCEKICEPSYIISLKTMNSGPPCSENLTFSCTLEQLQDLVQKLKDASRCLERNSSQ